MFIWLDSCFAIAFGMVNNKSECNTVCGATKTLGSCNATLLLSFSFARASSTTPDFSPQGDTLISE